MASGTTRSANPLATQLGNREEAESLLPQSFDKIDTKASNCSSDEIDTVDFGRPRFSPKKNAAPNDTKASNCSNDEIDTVDFGQPRFSHKKIAGPETIWPHIELPIKSNHDEEDVADPNYYWNHWKVLSEIEDKNLCTETFLISFLEACEKGDKYKLKYCLIPQLRKSSDLDILDIQYDDSSATALHLAILNKQEETAKLLIEEYGKHLIEVPYTESEYEGITALHLAIVKGMRSVVKEIIYRMPSSDIYDFFHKESTGTFLTEGWHTSSVPLALSLMSNQHEIFKLLAAKSNALHKSTIPQNRGNTIIHSLAVHSLRNPKHAVKCLEFLVQNKDCLEMTLDEKSGKGSGAVRLKILLTHENNDKFTPLMYAIHLGASDFWHALMQVEDVYKFSQWDFHPYEWNVYNVTELIKPQQPYHISGLELLAFSEHQQLEMFEEEPLRSLVDDKWHRNSWLYAASGLMHLLYMVLFSVAALTKNMMEEEVSSIMEERSLVICLTLGVLIVAVLFFLVQVVDFLKLLSSIPPEQIRGASFKSNFHASIKTLYRVSTIRALFAVTDAFIIAWAVARLAGYEREALLAVPPLVLGWYACTVYTLHLENSSIFMFMLNTIMTTNVVNFLFALFFILIGSSTAFINLQFVSKDAKPDGMGSIFSILSTLFRQTIAINDIDEMMDQYKYPVAARLLMIGFLIVATVLMLNMLIAAMNDTYNSIRDRKRAMWLRIKLQMALHIERRTFGLLNRMPKCCSYCKDNCKCSCENEKACKIYCKCNRVNASQDNTRQQTASMTDNAVSQNESKKSSNSSIANIGSYSNTGGKRDEVDQGKDGQDKNNNRKHPFFVNYRWKKFFFRMRNEDGKCQQTIYIKIKEFVKERPSKES